MGLAIEKEIVIELLEKTGIDPSCRPSILTIQDWVNLYEKNEQRI